MVGQKSSMVALFLCISSCAQSLESELVKIENNLSSCLSLTNSKIVKNEKVPILSVDLHVDKLIAECGCKSALGEYAIYSSKGDYRSYLIGGKITLLTSGIKYVPVSTDYGLINSGTLELSLSCARPD